MTSSIATIKLLLRRTLVRSVILFSMFETFLYIDPGSSYLVQVLIAAALGVAFFFKNIWLYIKSFFTRKQKTDKEN